jgi:XTP/dITP diphosphohydrolase
MVKASRIQEKVKGIGFEWDSKEAVWEKVKEEIEEFQVEQTKNSEHMEEEFGDVLFSLVNYARFVNINPENALAKTNKKFIDRFQLMEKMIIDEAQSIQDMNLTEMDVYWEKAKKMLQEKNH